ncbi:universal stress protein [Roseateles violae]|uniref:Universal stress protein n=1 Tax=Roseateles violae TaxID=3058042 RepID=A0ABT8DQ92_9BURK|nr:universal stress protein [Pelomonas sp. PFR6]MDN3920166.1 universal stress protein [Pelomonas sp. PFR6]
MYSKILVPIDGSETADKGLAEALRLAGLSGGRIRLLHIIDLQPLAGYPTVGMGLSAELIEMVRRGGKDLLAKTQAQVEANGLPVEAVLLESMGERVSDLVVRAAADWGAEIIVLGTHGRRGLGRALMGSDAELIVRHAAMPVLLVRGGPA